jgi:hypothetical protein
MAINSKRGTVFSTRSEREPRDATTEGLLGKASPMRLVSRLHNEGRQPARTRSRDTESEEPAPLEAVTRQRPVKTQQTEK